jgi:hypothetical protein
VRHAAVLGRPGREGRDHGDVPVSRPGRLALRLPPEDPADVYRLARFRQARPDVIIGDGGFGTWQARIPEPDGETVTTRYTLRELLDRLDELTGQQD